MIEREVRGLDGKITTELIPENEKDVETLRRLAQMAAVDVRDSFADDPEGADD